jgi:hypothetical protein
MMRDLIYRLLIISLVSVANSLRQTVSFASFVSSPYVSLLSNNTLQVKYVPSSTGTPVISRSKLIDHRFDNEATLEYEVKFDKNFEWKNGGKLPGLLGGDPKTKSTGCIVPQPKDAWSYRLMWRGDGQIEMYIYDQSRRSNNIACGVTTDSKKNVLTKNKWINFKMYMKLNTKAGKPDGVAKLYVDGVLMLFRSGIEFRGVDKGATINSLTFTTFYGGHDTYWSPSKTTYAQFRGATLYDYEKRT